MIAVRVFVFLGAFLLFTMEPMVGRMLLPHFGGAFHVWTTSLMFFQGVLFFAYAYAHLGEPRLGRLHFAAMAIPLLALPPTIVIAGVHDVPALLMALARASALPFGALATTSVVSQHWVSRSNLPDRDNPYWLYGTSNVGSMLSLVVYALAIEPFVGVSTQRVAFTVGFCLWMVAGVFAYRATHPAAASATPKPETRSDTTPEPEPAPITPGRIVYWLLLAACPSALLMGVTNVIALDAGNVPLVWIVPLALYLFTFVLAFDDPDRLPAPIHASWKLVRNALPRRFELPKLGLPARLRDGWEQLRDATRIEVPEKVPLRRVPDWVRRLWPAFGAVGLYAAMGGALRSEQQQVLLHLGVFLVLCLAAHAELYDARPEPRRLTLFYLVMSLGGWIGGAFVALVAPRVFDTLREYPIAIVVLVLTVLVGRWTDFRAWLRDAGVMPIAMGFLLIAVIVLQFARGTIGNADPSHLLTRARSFYGVYQVIERPTQIGPLRDLVSGVTRHGRQFMDSPYREEPLSYYHREGSLGEVMAILDAEHRPLDIAAIGLGVGAAAAYLDEDDRITFFEIDALDDQLARQYFHYLEDCRGHEETVIGDARVTLEELAASAHPPAYDLILVDAFSGDAIPTHLVTREATELYFRLLREHRGWLLFHVSNRYYNLRPVLAGIARALGRPGAWRQRRHPTGLGEDPSEYVVFPPSEDDLESFDAQGWTRFSAGGLPEVALWTDDRTNTLAILQIDLR